MKKETMMAIVAGLGAGSGTAIITNILIKRATRIEKKKQLLVKNVRKFMKTNKVGKHDYETLMYIKGLSLDGKSLSEQEIEELFERI